MAGLVGWVRGWRIGRVRGAYSLVMVVVVVLGWGRVWGVVVWGYTAMAVAILKSAREVVRIFFIDVTFSEKRNNLCFVGAFSL